MVNQMIEPQYQSINEEMGLSNFNYWQMSNATKLGFKTIQLDRKLTLNFRQIEKLFDDKIRVKDVNPLSADDNSSMGYAFYEWLAEAGSHIEDKLRSIEYAARHFSWQYPQLKMVIHEVREIRPDPDDEYFLDNIEFVVEFYS